MEISNNHPPLYEAILLAFPAVEEQKTSIFCHGDTIYNPFQREITPDLEVHEAVHMEQQGNDPAGWWQLYLTDQDFRLEQEIAAYGAQFAFAKKSIEAADEKAHKEGKMLIVGKTKLLDYALDEMAGALSGPTYGNTISFAEARSKIRNTGRSDL